MIVCSVTFGHFQWRGALNGYDVYAYIVMNDRARNRNKVKHVFSTPSESESLVNTAALFGARALRCSPAAPPPP